MSPPPPPPTARDPGRPTGGLLVIGLLVLGATLAAFALAFQRWQTSRCLVFYGGGIARAITSAPVVELWRLEPGTGPGRLVAGGRCDVSAAPGLVHLRRGLVEDANFDWRSRGGPRLPPQSWTAALAFRPAAAEPPTAILVLGAGEGGGEMCVVGRPGRIGLGRLEKGLWTWIGTACPELAQQGRY